MLSRLRLRELFKPAPYALGVDESVLGRLQRSLCAAVCNGRLVRLANRLRVEACNIEVDKNSLNSVFDSLRFCHKCATLVA